MRTALRRQMLLLMCCLLPWKGLLLAQDPYFSQQHAGMLYLNPAFAGTSGGRISLAYRNHYPALGASYVTYNASFDDYVDLLQGGLGVNLMHDRQLGGALSVTTMDAVYAYHLQVGPEVIISGAIQASYSYRSLSTSDLHFYDRDLNNLNLIDGSFGATGDNGLDEGKGYPDFGVGFLGISRFAWAGIAIHHLNRPNMSLSRVKRLPLPWKFTLHGGLVIPIYERRFGKEAVRLNPNAVITYQGGQSLFEYGLDIWTGPLFTGLTLRQNIPLSISSAVLLAGYSNDAFRLAYSYDFNVLKTYAQVHKTGAHEVTFSLKLQYKGRGSRSRGAIKFPVF